LPAGAIPPTVPLRRWPRPALPSNASRRGLVLAVLRFVGEIRLGSACGD
jgi:hypothetical protein